MKRIEAIIRPEKILDVKAALEELGYGGMTVTEVKGHGTQRGVMEQWQGQEFWIEFLPKLWFLIVVDDSDLETGHRRHLRQRRHRRSWRRQDIHLGRR